MDFVGIYILQYVGGNVKGIWGFSGKDSNLGLAESMDLNRRDRRPRLSHAFPTKFVTGSMLFADSPEACPYGFHRFVIFNQTDKLQFSPKHFFRKISNSSCISPRFVL
jgi:hypothetical protein